MKCIVCKRKCLNPKSVDAGKELTALLRKTGKVGRKSGVLVGYCGRETCKREISFGTWEVSKR